MTLRTWPCSNVVFRMIGIFLHNRRRGRTPRSRQRSAPSRLSGRGRSEWIRTGDRVSLFAVTGVAPLTDIPRNPWPLLASQDSLIVPLLGQQWIAPLSRSNSLLTIIRTFSVVARSTYARPCTSYICALQPPAHGNAISLIMCARLLVWNGRFNCRNNKSATTRSHTYVNSLNCDYMRSYLHLWYFIYVNLQCGASLTTTEPKMHFYLSL